MFFAIVRCKRALALTDIIYIKGRRNVDGGVFVLLNKDNETQAKKATRPLLLFVSTYSRVPTEYRPSIHPLY